MRKATVHPVATSYTVVFINEAGDRGHYRETTPWFNGGMKKTTDNGYTRDKTLSTKKTCWACLSVAEAKRLNAAEPVLVAPKTKAIDTDATQKALEDMVLDTKFTRKALVAFINNHRNDAVRGELSA